VRQKEPLVVLAADPPRAQIVRMPPLQPFASPTERSSALLTCFDSPIRRRRRSLSAERDDSKKWMRSTWVLRNRIALRRAGDSAGNARRYKYADILTKVVNTSL
jgi:hypothetical protein